MPYKNLFGLMNQHQLLNPLLYWTVLLFINSLVLFWFEKFSELCYVKYTSKRCLIKVENLRRVRKITPSFHKGTFLSKSKIISGNTDQKLQPSKRLIFHKILKILTWEWQDHLWRKPVMILKNFVILTRPSYFIIRIKHNWIRWR